MGLLNTISNYIELHTQNDAVKISKKSFFQQQALTTFLAGLREPMGSTIRAMRPPNLASAMQYIQEENNIRYLQKGPGITQPPTKALQPHRPPTHNPAPAFTPPNWQPFGPRHHHPSPWPTAQLFRPQPQPNFTSPHSRPAPVLQPPRFQPSQPPRFQPSQQHFNKPNAWTNGPGPSQFPKPTPMSTTSRAVSQNRAPNFRPPQQSTPRYTFEELFNIEQEEAAGYDTYTDESWNYYYPLDAQDHHQQEEETQYEEEKANFQEDQQKDEGT